MPSQLGQINFTTDVYTKDEVDELLGSNDAVFAEIDEALSEVLRMFGNPVYSDGLFAQDVDGHSYRITLETGPDGKLVLALDQTPSTTHEGEPLLVRDSHTGEYYEVSAVLDGNNKMVLAVKQDPASPGGFSGFFVQDAATNKYHKVSVDSSGDTTTLAVSQTGIDK